MKQKNLNPDSPRIEDSQAARYMGVSIDQLLWKNNSIIRFSLKNHIPQE